MPEPAAAAWGCRAGERGAGDGLAAHPIPEPQLCLAGFMPQPAVTKSSGFSPPLAGETPPRAPLCGTGASQRSPSKIRNYHKAHVQTAGASCSGETRWQLDRLLVSCSHSCFCLQPRPQRCKFSLKIRVSFCGCPCTPSVPKVWTRIFN